MHSIRDFAFCYIFSLFLFMKSDVNGSRERPSNTTLKNIRDVDPDELNRFNYYYNQQLPMYYRNKLTDYGKIAPPNIPENLPPHMSLHKPIGHPPYGHSPNEENSVHVYFVLPRLDSDKSKCQPSTETTKSVLTTTTRAPTTPPPCKPTFSRAGKHCYNVSKVNETWYVARNKCQSVGAELAYPVNMREHALLVVHIFKLTNNTEQRAWWIGGTRKDDKFVWDKTKSPISYDEWNIEEPSNSTGVDSCMLYTDIFKWNAASCNFSLPFVCQY